KGHKRFKEGTQKIVKLNQGKIIETRFLVVKPVRIILLEYKGMKEIDENKTKLVWGVRGSLAFPLSIFSLLQSVDKAYGEELNSGLRALKSQLEAKNIKTSVQEQD
ncbi:MAG: polyketide cyclase, partial [Gillisia sp.]